jgi:hypothetical protein
MAFSFEKLLVYQKAIDFADSVCTATEQFPRGYGFLANQLNRASLSIDFADAVHWYPRKKISIRAPWRSSSAEFSCV